jgi:tetratricopeptide (TPR) repeat protein
LRPRRLFARLGFAALVVWSVMIGLIGTLVPWTPYLMSTYAPLDVLAASLAKRNHIEAVSRIIDHTAYNPAAGYQQLGLHLWKEGRAREALQANLTAAKIEPNRGAALYAAGFLSRELGDSTTSAEMFSRVLAQEPGNSRAIANLGLAQLDLGRNQEAFASFQKALAMNRNNEDALTGMTTYYMRLNDLRQARVFAERLAIIKPNSPVAQAALHIKPSTP